MGYFIYLRAVVIGATYPRTYHPIQLFIGITSSGENKELLRKSWKPYIIARLREQVKKKPKWTILIIIDSHAVKNSCNPSIASKRFCFHKATNRIKRHLAVDVLEFPFFTHCIKANVTDDRVLIEMLIKNLDYFKLKPLELPPIRILLDNGYHPETIEDN